MAKKTFGPANDSYAGFDEELTLAELIQNAAARGLKSVRGTMFARPLTKEERELDLYDIKRNGRKLKANVPHRLGHDDAVNMAFPRLDSPPKGTTCVCALGAQLLSPRVTNPVKLGVMGGNDADDDQLIYGDERSLNIGAAFEQSLR